MAEMEKVRDNVIEQVLKRAGLMRKVREGVQELETAAEDAGLAHKALTVTKPADGEKPAADAPAEAAPEEVKQDEMVEDGVESDVLIADEAFVEAFSEALAANMDTVPENLTDLVRAALETVYAQMEPQEVEGGGEGEVPTMDEEMAKALTGIVDGVTAMQEAQKALADENATFKAQVADLTAQLAAMTAAVDALKGTPGALKAMDAEVKKLRNFLNKTPRIASKDKATVVTDEDLDEDVVKAMQAANLKVDPVWGNVVGG